LSHVAKTGPSAPRGTIPARHLATYFECKKKLKN
jgi:hypothetical protein